MKKILLACSAGMSTSLLVTRMEESASKKNIDVVIKAVPVGEVDHMFNDWDILLLGPQVRFQLRRVEKEVNGVIPVGVIDMRDYGMMNGEKVLETALKMIDCFKK